MEYKVIPDAVSTERAPGRRSGLTRALQATIVLVLVASSAATAILIRRWLGSGNSRLVSITDGRIRMTIILVGISCLLAILNGLALERSRPRWPALAGFALAFGGLVPGVVEAWGWWRWGWQFLIFPIATVWAWSLALGLIALLSTAHLPRRWWWVRQSAVLAIFLLALFVSDRLWLPWKSMGGTFPPAWLDVAAVGAMCAGVITVVLHELGKLKGRETLAESLMRVRLSCPRCGSTEQLSVGDSLCENCHLRLVIEIGEAHCDACGYPLYRLPGHVCPECGTPFKRIPSETEGESEIVPGRVE